MGLLQWLIVIVVAYIALGRALFVIIDAASTKNWKSLVAISAAVVVAAIVTIVLIHRGAEKLSPHSVLPAALLVLAGTFVAGAIGRATLTWEETRRRAQLSRQIKLHLVLATGALFFSLPFYWLITTSLKPDERTNVLPPDLIPMQQRRVEVDGEMRRVYLAEIDGRTLRVAKVAELEGGLWSVIALDGSENVRTLPGHRVRPDIYPALRWQNYGDALAFLPPEYQRGLRPLWNTVFVTLMSMVATVLSSSLVAFSFARLRWPARDLLFVVMLATMMIPGAVTMLPVFLIFRSLNWIDTLNPLWVGALFGNGFNIFLLRQFFLTIPTELEDAAKIDGCSYFVIYWKIMLPLIKPALAAISIFAFMGSWNNFMGPLIYISSPEKMTLAYALQLFQGLHGGEPAMMMAAATLVMFPVLVVFFFTQRYIIEGVTLTGIKG